MLILLAALAACSGRVPPRPHQAVPGLAVDDSALRQWQFLFQGVSDVEWMTCLYGRVEGRTIHIEESQLADVASAGYAAVSGHCRTRRGVSLVGLAHSHPIAPDGTVNCLPSHTDVADLGRPWRVIVVVCGATDAAVKLGFRAAGRHPVVRTLTVRARPVPLHLGGWGDVERLP